MAGETVVIEECGHWKGDAAMCGITGKDHCIENVFCPLIADITKKKQEENNVRQSEDQNR